IIAYHDQKTFNKDYSALFAVSSIKTLIKYYDIFKRKKEAGEHNLRIAAIFSFGANEDDEEAEDYLSGEDLSMAAEAKAMYGSAHSRDKLDAYIGDYNKQYGTSFSTRDSES